MAWRSRKRRGFAARRSGLRSPPPTSPPAEADRWTALTAKAGDFETIRHAVDDAGGFVRGLWVTFVSLQAYLAIATGSITHRQLFLEAPIKLPLIDVELPLVTFFVLAPALFLVFHYYLLIQLRLLADKVARLNQVLAAARPPEASADAVERDLRLQLPNDIIVQYLAGPRDSRERGLRRALGLVAWATLVAAPLLVLTTMQLKFLPYQDVVVTWVHRAAVLFDVAMLWSLWPGVLKRRTRSKARYPGLRRGASFARNALASVAVIWASTQALTFPTEWMDDLPPAQAFHHAMVWPLLALKSDEAKAGPANAKGGGPQIRDSMLQRIGWPSFSEWLLARVAWPDDFDHLYFLNTTPQANRVIVGALRLANETLVDEEKVKRSEERGKALGLQRWQGERTLRFTQARHFFAADLSSADLTRADFSRCLFDHAYAKGVTMSGARLDEAQLNFADFRAARLDNASLNRAQLQGASLNRAQLQGASIDSAMIGRATGDPVLRPTYGKVITDLMYESDNRKAEPITDGIVDGWTNEIKQYVKSEKLMNFIQIRLARLKQDGISKKEDDEIRQFWRAFNSIQPDPNDYTRIITELVCQYDGPVEDIFFGNPGIWAPYVARAWINQANRGDGVLPLTGDALPGILAKMQSGRDNLAACPGVDGFTKDDWAALDKLFRSHKPPPPTPAKTSNAPAPNLP